MNANTTAEPEFAHHLAVAEDQARTVYPPAALRDRELYLLKNIRDFAAADVADEDVVYATFDRAQTRHHAAVVRDLMAAEIDRR